MMYIQNIGSKIVNVGSIVLLPGKQMKASDEVAMSGPVQALVKRGHLRTVKPKVKATTATAVAATAPAAVAETAASTDASNAKQAAIVNAVAAAKKRTKKAADTSEATNTTETTAAQEG